MRSGIASTSLISRDESFTHIYEQQKKMLDKIRGMDHEIKC
jgi:hypothetical protein